MFKAKQLDKLVKANIITPEKKEEILAFDDRINFNMLNKTLSLLGIFILILGIISVISANWENITPQIKLLLLFTTLCTTSVITYKNYLNNNAETYEKLLAFLFLLIGASLGLIIQIFNLSSPHAYNILFYWCLLGLPLLLISKKNYTSLFFIPLFLIWTLCHISYTYFETPHNITNYYIKLLLIFAIYTIISHLINQRFANLAYFEILKKFSLKAFYLTLFFYILSGTFTPLLILMAICLTGYYKKDYKTLKTNIKLIGLWCFSIFIHYGYRYGLFNTGLGLIISGSLLLLTIKYLLKKSIPSYLEKKND